MLKLRRNESVTLKEIFLYLAGYRGGKHNQKHSHTQLCFHLPASPPNTSVPKHGATEGTFGLVPLGAALSPELSPTFSSSCLLSSSDHLTQIRGYIFSPTSVAEGCQVCLRGREMWPVFHYTNATRKAH